MTSFTQAGFYLHIPFCRKICPFCAYSVTQDDPEARQAYLGLLMQEIDLWREREPFADMRASSVYVGGGTPSLLSPQALAKLLEKVKEAWPLADNQAEITLELEPVTKTRSELKEIRVAGVNRLSIGVQTLSDQELTGLGRNHSSAQALAAYEDAREAGFENISLDVIYGFDGQSPETWRATLDQIMRLAPEHVSIYGISLEPGTPYAHKYNTGIKQLLPEDITSGMYKEAMHSLAENGYIQYEIANFAQPERASKHNSAYWNFRPYLGLGASSASFFPYKRWRNAQSPSDYAARIKRGEFAIEEEETLQAKDRFLEILILGLRTCGGVDLEAAATIGGVEVKKLTSCAKFLASRDLISFKDGTWRLTDNGKCVADAVIVQFSDAADI